MTLLNFSGTPLTFVPPKGLSLLAASVPQPSPASVAAWGALVFG
jgi:hypothetical protein